MKTVGVKERLRIRGQRLSLNTLCGGGGPSSQGLNNTPSHHAVLTWLTQAG
jgi:hypothetical protein